MYIIVIYGCVTYLLFYLPKIYLISLFYITLFPKTGHYFDGICFCNLGKTCSLSHAESCKEPVWVGMASTYAP